jgi:hypothetical protein
MPKRLVRLPSPALVIAMVALALVLGGTAAAATAGKHTDAKADTKLIKKLAPTLSVKDAKMVGGKRVKQFFANLPENTAPTKIFAIDGVTVKAACNGAEDPELSIENDSGHAGSLGGYGVQVGDLHVDNFSSSPVDLSNGSNGGGEATAMLITGVVVSVQWAQQGNLGGAGTSCVFSGSVIAS